MTNVNDLVYASNWLIEETGYGLESCHDDMLLSYKVEIDIDGRNNKLVLQIRGATHAYELHFKKLRRFDHHYGESNYSIDTMECEPFSMFGYDYLNFRIIFNNQNEMVVISDEVWLENLKKCPTS